MFINEDLTRLRARMMKVLKEKGEFKAIHSREGKIFLQLKNQSSDRFIVLESPDDLFKVGFNQIPEELGLK